MSYNVRNMQTLFAEKAQSVNTHSAVLDTINNICKQISGIVASEDSNLSSTWNALGDNYGKCYSKVGRVMTSLKDSVDEFAKATIAAEQASASANEAISSAISDNSDKLDALDY